MEWKNLFYFEISSARPSWVSSSLAAFRAICRLWELARANEARDWAVVHVSRRTCSMALSSALDQPLPRQGACTRRFVRALSFELLVLPHGAADVATKFSSKSHVSGGSSLLTPCLVSTLFDDSRRGMCPAFELHECVGDHRFFARQIYVCTVVFLRAVVEHRHGG